MEQLVSFTAFYRVQVLDSFAWYVNRYQEGLLSFSQCNFDLKYKKTHFFNFFITKINKLLKGMQHIFDLIIDCIVSDSVNDRCVYKDSCENYGRNGMFFIMYYGSVK